MYYAPLLDHVDGNYNITIINCIINKIFCQIRIFKLKYNNERSIHQEFERFMRDEMDDQEEKYIKSKNYQK